jgi:hypothetical protein
MIAQSIRRLMRDTGQATIIVLWICFGAMNGSSVAQEQSKSGDSVVHTFKLWGLLRDPVEKLDMYMGFTNGFFAGPRSPKFLAFADCLESRMTSDQAIAMIDKYYKDNPQRWGSPLGTEIVASLIVKGWSMCGKRPVG